MVYNVEFYELSIETGMEEYIALGPLQMVVQIVQGETCVTGLLNNQWSPFFLPQTCPTPLDSGFQSHEDPQSHSLT